MRFVVLLILIFLNMLFKERERERESRGELWFDVKEFSFLTKKESEGN